MKKPIIIIQYAAVLPICLFGLVIRFQGSPAAEHNGTPAECLRDDMHDKQQKAAAARYYWAVTNGLAVMENLIEVRSLFYAVNWRPEDEPRQRAVTDTAKGRVPVAGADIDDLLDPQNEQAMTVETLQLMLNRDIEVLEDYIAGRTRTREDWVKTLGQDQVLELLATEAHYKAELFRQVETKIRDIQNKEKKRRKEKSVGD